MGDADITLRHIIRRHPEAIARAMASPDQPVEVLGWADTQLTALERRMDRLLRLRVGGQPRMLHTEFQVELTGDVRYRVYEYQALSIMALRAEVPDEPLPPIETVVVVLTGRSKAWPSHARFRSGWPESKFSGVRFRVDAVYQRTVAELTARGSVFWLVFTPLARDATRETMGTVVQAIQRQAPDAEERAELYFALLVMADLDPGGHNLRQEIVTMLEATEDELFKRSSTLRKAYEKGGREAVETILRTLFVRRIGRTLTPEEQQALARHAEQLGAERVGEVVLDLDGDALAAWLADPNAR
jgi:hypothetical protein